MITRKPNRKRDVHLRFWCTPEEAEIIRNRMTGIGVTSFGAYMRKLAIDGYIVNIDMTEIRKLTTLLGRCSGNLNQYARRANETGSIYTADIADLRERLDEIGNGVKELLTALSRAQ